MPPKKRRSKSEIQAELERLNKEMEEAPDESDDEPPDDDDLETVHVLKVRRSDPNWSWLFPSSRSGRTGDSEEDDGSEDDDDEQEGEPKPKTRHRYFGGS